MINCTCPPEEELFCFCVLKDLAKISAESLGKVFKETGSCKCPPDSNCFCHWEPPSDHVH